jgi:hypothetical protein
MGRQSRWSMTCRVAQCPTYHEELIYIGRTSVTGEVSIKYFAQSAQRWYIISLHMPLKAFRPSYVGLTPTSTEWAQLQFYLRS